MPKTRQKQTKLFDIFFFQKIDYFSEIFTGDVMVEIPKKEDIKKQY
jgi:hypothetical protein